MIGMQTPSTTEEVSSAEVSIFFEIEDFFEGKTKLPSVGLPPKGAALSLDDPADAGTLSLDMAIERKDAFKAYRKELTRLESLHKCPAKFPVLFQIRKEGDTSEFGVCIDLIQNYEDIRELLIGIADTSKDGRLFYIDDHNPQIIADGDFINILLSAFYTIKIDRVSLGASCRKTLLRLENLLA